MLTVGVSCDSNQKKAQEAPTWKVLTIISENHEVITINNQDDTSTIRHYDNGSIFQGWHKTKVDSLKSYFTKAEKDSLYNIVESIIANPVKPTNTCTDFVGDLKLLVDYGSQAEFERPGAPGVIQPGSFRQSIEYTGICDWKNLSPNTTHLYKILKRKIKWWNK
jgi:hypothetical protein